MYVSARPEAPQTLADESGARRAARGEQVSLAVPTSPVEVGRPHVVTGAGWPPQAPVTLATTNEALTVARYVRLTTDGSGRFSQQVVISEPGIWTHRGYLHPDPATPPRDQRASVRVVVVVPGRGS